MLGWARRVLAVEDPGNLNLRKAPRAAVVTPALLAFGIFVLGNDALATYAFFGGFVALVFADYGGPPRQRAGAYLTMTGLGAAAIAVGGLLASQPVPAALVMFAIVFGLSMDYEVFIMSRIREDYSKSKDAHASVLSGLAASTRVITAAALIMISVFAMFLKMSLRIVLRYIGHLCFSISTYCHCSTV